MALLLQAYASGWGAVGTAAVLAWRRCRWRWGRCWPGRWWTGSPPGRCRWRPRPGRRLICAATALSQVLGASAVWLLLGLLLLQVGQAVAGPTWSALLPALVPVEELPAAVGGVQALSMLLGLAGPVVAGTASSWAGRRWPCCARPSSRRGGRAGRAGPGSERSGTGATRRTGPPVLDGYRFLRTEPGPVGPGRGLRGVRPGRRGHRGGAGVPGARGDLGASEVVYGVLGSVIGVGLVAGSLLAARGPGRAPDGPGDGGRRHRDVAGPRRGGPGARRPARGGRAAGARPLQRTRSTPGRRRRSRSGYRSSSAGGSIGGGHRGVCAPPRSWAWS